MFESWYKSNRQKYFVLLLFIAGVFLVWFAQVSTYFIALISFSILS